MQWIDWLILLAYLATLTGIGIYFARRQTSFNEFFRGGRQVGWLALGLSLMAALNSGIDYIQTPAIVFSFGMAYMGQIFTWIPLYFWVTRVTLPFYQKLNFDSPYEYLERRFGIGVRVMAALIFVCWRVGWMGVALYVPCLAVKAATGGQTDITWMVLLTGTIVTFYTMLGGIKAVVWTDVVQFFVMFGGLLATLLLILGKVPGGVAEVLNLGIETQKLNLAAQIPGWSQADLPGKLYLYFTTEVTFVGIFVCILVGRVAAFTCDQVAIQRFRTTSSYSEARNAYVINALTDAIWMIVLGFVGLALFAYFQHASFPEHLQNDKVLPYFMSQVFPVGLMGLVVASIFAASLSSVDAALNSTTSIIVVDFYNRFWRTPHGGKAEVAADNQARQVLVSRAVNLLLGGAMILIASNVERMGELYTVANKVLGAFFGALSGVFLLGMFSRRANGRGVLTGAFTGLTVSCFLSFFSVFKGLHGVLLSVMGADLVDFCSHISWQWPPVIGAMTTLATGYLISLACSANADERAPLTFWEVTKRTSLPESSKAISCPDQDASVPESPGQ